MEKHVEEPGIHFLQSVTAFIYRTKYREKWS